LSHYAKIIAAHKGKEVVAGLIGHVYWKILRPERGINKDVLHCNIIEVVLT
jgi:hypothetical protein